jgi:hypothetical protein
MEEKYNHGKVRDVHILVGTSEANTKESYVGRRI